MSTFASASTARDFPDQHTKLFCCRCSWPVSMGIVVPCRHRNFWCQRSDRSRQNFGVDIHDPRRHTNVFSIGVDIQNVVPKRRSSTPTIPGSTFRIFASWHTKLFTCRYSAIHRFLPEYAMPCTFFHCYASLKLNIIHTAMRPHSDLELL